MYVTRLLAAAALATAALVTAAPASASPEDDAFIETIQQQGITFPSTDYAISTAKEVCALIDGGRTPESVAEEISNNSGLGVEDTGFFVGASIGVYCPWNQDKI